MARKGSALKKADGAAKKGNGRAVGVRDVAARAGVSLGTVSNVLNNPARVGPEIRERVQGAMKELGFVPSRAAGQLRSRKSGLIGVVVPDVGNPFWAKVLRGVETVVDAAELTMVVGSIRQDDARQRHLLRVLDSQGVDGLIIAPIVAPNGELQPFENRRYGVVTLERDGGATSGAWVGLDNVVGAGLAMTHLLEQGHRRIALVNGSLSVSWCAERRVGAVSAIEQAGLEPEAVLVDLEVPDLTVDEGTSAMRQLLAGEQVTAVMCVNDMLALGALLELRARGVRVPEQMALVGYDDADFAPALDPPLTTVHQPAFMMGETAAKLLLEEPDKRSGTQVGYVPRLVVRGSSVVAES